MEKLPALKELILFVNGRLWNGSLGAVLGDDVRARPLSRNAERDHQEVLDILKDRHDCHISNERLS